MTNRKRKRVRKHGVNALNRLDWQIILNLDSQLTEFSANVFNGIVLVKIFVFFAVLHDWEYNFLDDW